MRSFQRKIGNVFHTLLDALYVPKCVCCGTVLEKNQTVFCDACHTAYEDAKQRECGRCFRPRSRCVCSRRPLESVRVSRLIKLCAYRPKRVDSPESRLIFSLKHDHRRDVIEFTANELSYAIGTAVKGIHQYTIVHAPRSRAAIRADGYDHTALLARELAKLFEISHQHAILRRKGGKTQKRLSFKERYGNIRELLYPNPKVDLAGKRVLLLDDITTSGATIAESARLLYGMGAKEVIGVVIAVTGRDSTDKPRKYSVNIRSKK